MSEGSWIQISQKENKQDMLQTWYESDSDMWNPKWNLQSFLVYKIHYNQNHSGHHQYFKVTMF